jgi:transcriptional regulator with XRE-family HTH domain
MALYSEDFSNIFSDLIGENGITCYQISQYSGLDQGYLSRLKKVEMNNPSPKTIVKIAVSLAHCNKEISITDIKRLFNACGRSL